MPKYDSVKGSGNGKISFLAIRSFSMEEEIDPIVKKYVGWYLELFEDEYPFYGLEKAVLRKCILEGMLKAGDVEQLHIEDYETKQWKKIFWRPKPRALPRIEAEIRKVIKYMAGFEPRKKGLTVG